MNSQERRKKIEEILDSAKEPVTATTLSKEFSVSRQVIVGDIALLRAQGVDIIATPRGYIKNVKPESEGIKFTVACKHDKEGIVDELYSIVDNGGTVMDVTVDHPVYGEISGELRLSTRYEVDVFWDEIKNGEVRPLSNLTGGIHLHKIKCKDEITKQRIIEVLDQKNILLKSE